MTYGLYSSSDTGVIPKPYVTALGGETYKYESTGGAQKKIQKISQIQKI
jgi:hypothetical protein